MAPSNTSNGDTASVSSKVVRLKVMSKISLLRCISSDQLHTLYTIFVTTTSSYNDFNPKSNLSMYSNIFFH